MHSLKLTAMLHVNTNRNDVVFFDGPFLFFFEQRLRGSIGDDVNIDAPSTGKGIQRPWQGFAKVVGDKNSVIRKNQATDKRGIVFSIRIASLA